MPITPGSPDQETDPRLFLPRRMAELHDFVRVNYAQLPGQHTDQPTSHFLDLKLPIDHPTHPQVMVIYGAVDGGESRLGINWSQRTFTEIGAEVSAIRRIVPADSTKPPRTECMLDVAPKVGQVHTKPYPVTELEPEQQSQILDILNRTQLALHQLLPPI